MNLPWWDDMKHSQEQNYWHKRNIWLPHSYHHFELKERIKEYPLTPKLIREFNREHIEVLDWCHYTDGTLSKAQSHILFSKIPWKFEIYISRHVDEEEKTEGLIHEFAHGIYRAGDEYEKLIQAETLRFYEGGNRFFMKTLLRRHLHPSAPPK